MTVNFVFSPAALAQFPALRGWAAAYTARLPDMRPADIAVGDFLRLQGIPAPEALVVFMRSWEVMNDEATLTIGLTLAPAETSPRTGPGQP